MIDKSRRKPARGTLPEFLPVPRQTSRHDGWTEERQRAFIEALADTGSVASAAKAVNMSSVGAYYLRRQPEAESFRKAWEAALKLGIQRLEDVAMERALHGVEVPVYHFGAVVGARRVYNDRLLMFLLRNRASKRFRADANNHDAPTRQELNKLKKQWRKEWEAETFTDVRTVRASIDRKVEEIKQRVLARRAEEEAAMSDETRDLQRRYEESLARDRAAHEQTPPLALGAPEEG